MATEIFEDELRLEAGTLEAIYPTPENPGECYPYPGLRTTGRTSPMGFRAVILENAYLRVTIVPELGGRILSFFDKRTETEILPQEPLISMPGGPRGVHLDAGILLDIGYPARMNSMGPVEYQIRDHEEEETPLVILHELIAGLGVSWHATLALPEDRAELHLSVKVQNRQLVPSKCRQGVRMWLSNDAQASCLPNSLALFSNTKQSGLAIHASEAMFECAESESGALSLWRSKEHDLLFPRQCESWSIVIQPFSKLPTLDGWSSEAGVSLHEKSLRVQAMQQQLGSKVVVETAEGQSFEAATDLYPERATVMDVSSMPALSGVAVRDREGNDLLVQDLVRKPDVLEFKALGLSLPSSLQQAIQTPGTREQLALSGIAEADPERIVIGLGIPGLQSASRIALAQAALDAKQIDDALVLLEDAASFNAEDHLLWWLKATVKRLHGREEEEDQDLPTAHFLAPLEPALRVESFLRMPQTHGKEPSAIIKPLANHPEAMIDAACLLLEAGLHEEAMRWMDEARRHRDEPMLRYLQAWSLLEKTRMAVEAAELVRGASAKPIEPPYPWRPLERKAVRALADRFPEDARLQSLKSLSASL